MICFSFLSLKCVWCEFISQCLELLNSLRGLKGFFNVFFPRVFFKTDWVSTYFEAYQTTSRDTMFECLDSLSKEMCNVQLLVHIFAFFTLNILITFLSKLSLIEEKF